MSVLDRSKEMLSASFSNILDLDGVRDTVSCGQIGNGKGCSAMRTFAASEVTYIVSGGALNSTHSLCEHC